MTLEAAFADREHRVIGFRQSLEVLRTTLKTQPFMGGEATNYGDYLVLGGFHVGSEYKPLQASVR
jgi:glutathione S-transferase